jgi:hypothetical protein
MATIVHTHPAHVTKITSVRKFERATARRLPHPRPGMVRSVGLILVGMVIPFLMAIGVLPLSLALGFVAFILVAIGSMSALILCGEI